MMAALSVAAPSGGAELCHFPRKDFAALVTRGFGWKYVDTSIPAGLPESVCWAYPWYWAHCASYQPAETAARFGDNSGAGLRLDAGKGVFRLLGRSQWVDFGHACRARELDSHRIDFGAKF